MKLKPKYICISIAFFVATAGINAMATLLTFDSLPAGGPLDVTPPVVPNGYGGLNWNNFAVADGLQFGTTTGYHTGVVSPDNVAFNPYGDPDSITASGGLFDLSSAYLTAALNLGTPLDIQVQGYLDATLLYNQTYVINNSGPTLIDFDYDGVNKVTFTSIPGQPFVMDNLDVSIPDTSDTLVLFGITTFALVICKSMSKKLT
jgi:hypothetical protein